MRITGTFLNEISGDIPSLNWGRAEWAADFDAMQAIGIDTVILIRAGHWDQCVFDSKALAREVDIRPAYVDLMALFLDQAERTDMTFFFGTYDSGRFWVEGEPEREVEINLRFTEEVAEKYSGRKAFGGWYISHEIAGVDEDAMVVYERLARHLKALKDLPILISPYVHGRKQFSDPTTPEAHEQQWEEILSRVEGLIDICAFQDGQVGFGELPTYLEINGRLARKHGLACWSNTETFERGMPINFLPIDWRNLRYKLEAADKAGVEKVITFEFSHFMSPHSVYPAAHNLYERYCEWLEDDAESGRQEP